MAGIRELVECYLPDIECDDFAEWAFGPSYAFFQRSHDFFSAWNQRHADEYRIYATGRITEDLPEMIKMWQARKTEDV